MLVVDDDIKTQELLNFYLQQQGYSVVIASNGIDAIEIARTQQPFIAITLDIMMPWQDGWATLSASKEEPLTSDIPVIIISIVDEKNLGFSLGALDYITKPIDKCHLLSSLNNIKKPVKDILVIDDSKQDAALMHAMLEPEGYSVHTEEGGTRGLAAIQKKQPDLLILDLMMPDMSGFEVIRQLKLTPETAQIPIFIVSAKTLTEIEAEYLRKNTEGLLVKGQYKREDMVGEVTNCLARISDKG